MRLGALACFLLFLAAPVMVRAAELPLPVARWYDALRKADAEAVSALLTEDAKVELKDLGVVQTREEFVESMDSWADAIEGGAIETKVQEAGSVTVDVCYRFPENQQRNREIFAIAGDRIAGVVQEAVAADCNGF